MQRSDNVARLDDYRSPIADGVNYDADADALEIEQPDGSVVIQFGGTPRGNNDPNADAEQDFYRNLADEIDPSVLASIAYELLDGIQADEQSRTQWVTDRTEGLALLAVKIEKARAELGGSGAPMEGMSSVRHPLLLEATIRHQSNAKRELLPAAGPVKIKNEGLGVARNDSTADKLEDLLNRYFTEFAPEYYPDTDRMFFDQGFSGMGFKKCFHCPIRRRPCSDSVPSQDLIVSNDATDLRTAARVTQRIMMSKATVKRMQYVRAYRDVALTEPDHGPVDQIKQKQGNIQGVTKSYIRPQDQEYLLYESYVSLDIGGFEHEDDDGEHTGLPMPYKVVVDKASRQILEVRRNWEEDDAEKFEARRVFIAFPYVPMFGFWATGLLHILGNTTTAVTAAWRVMLDSGMFANFPGFLYGKSGGRQDDLNFRIPPGGGAAVDLNGAEDIRKTVMPLPYKDPGATTMQLVDNIIATGREVGNTANLIDPSGVKQNMPVGTMMGMIEQVSQTITAVHERMYIAQSHEFQQMRELFREDPESLWRFIEKDGTWTFDELVNALNTYSLVPVADPNTPTHIHRIMKMTTLNQLEQQKPELYNPKAVHERILRSMKLDDPESLFAPPAPPGAAPVDPAVTIANATKETKMAQIQADAQQSELDRQAKARETDLKHQLDQAKLEVQRLLGQETNETRVTVAEIAAEGRDRDRASTEHLKTVELARDVAHNPFDDDNHQKALELKKAGPPKNGPSSKT